jgi:two-component system, chemotaxis family, sensor kinase Cph1
MTPPEGSPSPRVGADPKGALGGAPDRHRLEGEVARLKSRVAQLEREKADVDAFAAVAAHELMEPLVMIEVHAAMLAAAGKPDLAVEAAEGLGRAASRLRRIVEAILHDARAGEEGIAMHPVDLDRVLSDVLVLLRPEIDARSARVVRGPMPTVTGDEALLGGLFTNLLTNALKYGPRANANIEIAAEREGAYWRVSIEDDGPPIPGAERGRIFEPFQRAQHERRSRGTGLGLSICRRIAERHGGRIGLAPQDAGNCFYFMLPD